MFPPEKLRERGAAVAGMIWYPPLQESFTSMAEALLVGVLIGAQRETVKEGHRAGIRDFVAIALAGGICGLLQNTALTAVLASGVAAVLVTSLFKSGELRGITTELAALATFGLAYLLTVPQFKESAPLAIGITIVLVFALEAKTAIHRFVRETITATEFNDTLRFLAVVLVILPILPEGPFGPYGFLMPRKIWLFVILVSSLSFIGYFLQKFLGDEHSRNLVAVLGGLASTTATTAAFAKDCAQDKTKLMQYWQAATLTNAIQFPRVAAIVLALFPAALGSVWPELAAMAGAGLLLALILAKCCRTQESQRAMPLGNPFRFLPALKFGVLFTVILFASRWAASTYGEQGVYWGAALAGSFDADSVTASLAGMVQEEKIPVQAFRWGLLVALFSNAVLKTVLAFAGGNARFGWRVAASFLVMFAAGAAVLLPY